MPQSIKRKIKPAKVGKKLVKLKIVKKKAKKTIAAGGEVARYPVNGVGAVARKAFNDDGPAQVLEGLDATMPRHLTLPVNVGPYTVIRTTTVVNTDRTTIGFGFFRGHTLEVEQINVVSPATTEAGYREGWLPICGFSGNDTSVPNENTGFFGIPQLEQLGSAATLTPAAMTMQLMNPGALATEATSGVVYVGATKTQFRLQGSTENWESIGQNFVSYQAPRLCASSKLALRGVHVNAKPVNIQEMLDFDRIIPSVQTDGTSTYGDFATFWSTASRATGNSVRNQTRSLKGFAPIMVYNPNRVSLQALITCEWRVRFDYGHPASSTHTCRSASTTQKWDMVQRVTDAIGHGCCDIVEHVANVGSQYVRGRLSQAAIDMMA